jgi:hypothetical protein
MFLAGHLTSSNKLFLIHFFTSELSLFPGRVFFQYTDAPPQLPSTERLDDPNKLGKPRHYPVRLVE